MRNKLIFIVAVLIQCVFIEPVLGQTALELEGKYGTPIIAYSVSEHLWMTPEFTNDGQICRARLYPARISADTNYLGVGDTLDLWELKDVLSQLTSPQMRGEKSQPFGMSLLLGQMAETIFTYKNVTFTFLSSLNFSSSKDSKKATPAQSKSENPMNSDEVFGNSFVRSAEIVTVSWADRTCANK
ncbi:MAG: hypothetical protein QOH63_926 [Acidobacteriota bacterium]|jgi:hypothetical protein|nr:hypothetical protein [Acidobacteriota bacterium]